MNKPIKVKDLKHLKDLCQQCYDSTGSSGDFFIALNGGRSSKDIFFNYEENQFSVFNYIDETEQNNMDTIKLWTQSNIGPALDCGALYFRGEN